MLSIESKSLDYLVDGATRTSLLESLQEQGFEPLIRSTRLHLYEAALMSGEQVREMERALAARAEREGEPPYVRGDLFCVEEYAHFLLFGDEAGEGVRAGIIYESGTFEPLEKLDAFCRGIRVSLEAARVGNLNTGNTGEAAAPAAAAPTTAASTAPPGSDWKLREARVPDSFRRFAGAVASATPADGRAAEMAEGWLRGSGMLEDSQARDFLRRLSKAHEEGRPLTLPADEERTAETLVNRLTEAGLLKREILVSCRKAGRALFRLPSPDAFSILSGSNAICSECGAAIADEKAEEITVPTALAAPLLQDGAWLTTHLRSILSKLGVPEKQIIGRPLTSGNAEVSLLANVCGEAFLFLLRDGDWTAAETRRALDEHASVEGTHLVIIATGKIHDDARLRLLREHARRRTPSGGRELEPLLIEGLEAVAADLQPVFERVTAKFISEELWELDTSLGVSAGQLIATRFRLTHKPDALRDLAAPAIASMSGSLHEF